MTEPAESLENHRQEHERLKAELAAAQEEQARWYAIAVSRKAAHKTTQAQLALAEELLEELTQEAEEAVLTITFTFTELPEEDDIETPIAMSFNGNGTDPIENLSKGLARIHTHLQIMINHGADIQIQKEQGEGWKN